MQDFLRWLAELKGADVEAGAELRLEFTSFPSGGLALLSILAVVAALLMVVLVYRRDGRSLSPGRRLVLAGLRLLAVLVALLIVFEPTVVAVKKDERPGHSILLLDLSRSMNQTDAFRRSEVSALATGWSEAGVAKPGEATKLDLAKAALSHRDHELLRELAKRNRLMVYGFGSGIEPLPMVAPDPPKDASPGVEDEKSEPVPPRIDWAKVRAEGRYSDIGGAIRSALERSREASIASVVVLTDGRRNTGPQGAEIARWIGQRKVPSTLVLPVGDPSETQLVEIARVDAPEKVFQRDPFKLTAQIAARGYPSTPISVRLRRVAQGATEGGEVVGTQTVEIGGDRPDVTVEFPDQTATVAGLFTYQVELDPPAGESRHPDRHVRQTQIEVLSEQTRVLLVAGGPSYEYQILRNQLTRDKTIELRCWLTSADPDFAQDGNLSIEALPKDAAEMAEIDVIILCDPNTKKLSAEFCRLAADHVLDGGAGLWWIAGEKYTLDALRPSSTTGALAELLPVEADMTFAEQRQIGFGRAFDRAWSWVLTPAGEAHKVTRIVDDKEQSKALWPRLAGFHFAFPMLRAKPAATTLLVHGNPQKKNADGRHPIVALQRVKAGRVLFSATDESYRWRSIFEDAYNRFWVKGIRWLYEGRLTAGNSRLQMVLSEDELDLGEAIELVVEAKDEAYRELIQDRFELRVTKNGEVITTLSLDAVSETPGSFRGSWRPTATGLYRIDPVMDMGKGGGTTVEVKPAATEKPGPADLAELGAIAAVDGGVLCRTPAELLAAAQAVPSLTAVDVYRTGYGIWDTWITIALLLALLSLEWILRKRFNLL